MKALRFYGERDVRIEDVDVPTPGVGEVLIKVSYAGICGSDLHFYFEPEHSAVDWNVIHPLTGAGMPQILGHEFGGTVAGLGPGVVGLEIGDPVTVWPMYYCGSCAACRVGVTNACTFATFHGIRSHGGGMAEYTTVRAQQVHLMPEGLDPRLAALVEPMAVAWHAVARSGIVAGRTALISGAGPIGVGVWFALRARGVETIVVSEPSADRRVAIRGIGAATIIDPRADSLSERIGQLTRGSGVDFAFDAAGSGIAVIQALDCLTVRGRLTIVAIHEKPFDFNPLALVTGEREIIGVLGYSHEDYDEVIAAMNAGVYDLTGWVETTDLTGVAAGFQQLRSGEGMKLLVEPRS